MNHITVLANWGLNIIVSLASPAKRSTSDRRNTAEESLEMGETDKKYHILTWHEA